MALAIYAPKFAAWSISGDEFYTYEDSTFSIAKMLSFNSRPLYFIVCHYLLKWNPGWPVEFVIRVPALLASSLTAPVLYLLVKRCRHGRIGLFAAILALASPWVFQMSQFGRYYAFVICFAAIATVAAQRAVEERDLRWGLLATMSGLLAAVSHPPAILLLPAFLVAWLCVRFQQNPQQALRLLRSIAWLLGLLLLGGTGVAAYLLQDVLREWASAGKGDFGGNYSLAEIIASLVIVGGLATWALALLPLLRQPSTWSTSEVFLTVVLVSSTAVLLALVPFGGGVSSRYLLYALPSLFLLAAEHWQSIDRRLEPLGYRVALGCMLLGCNVPQMLSIAADGDHYDYRTMARLIETLDLPNPIIYSSSHRLMDYYLDDRFEVMAADADDVGDMGERLPRDLIERAIAKAEREDRPLLIASRQDRHLLAPNEQAWLYARFAVLRTVERARYDHRRHRIVLYQYRPIHGRPDLSYELTCAKP